MDIANMEAFIYDIINVIQERYEEAQNEFNENKGDAFISGRSLAYQEVFEIIKNRIDIYDINIDD